RSGVAPRTLGSRSNVCAQNDARRGEPMTCRAVSAASGLLLWSAACLHVEVQVSPAVTRSCGAVHTLGVAQLENLTAEPAAAAAMSGALVNELRSRGDFSVIEIEEPDRVEARG